MNENLLMISSRIRELREILGIEAADLAGCIGVSPEVPTRNTKRATLDIPISKLYDIAFQLGTDMTVLLTGEQPRMDTHCIVRAGRGVDIERYPGYKYSSIAFNFKNREMEPLIVTLSPEDEPALPVIRTAGRSSTTYWRAPCASRWAKTATTCTRAIPSTSIRALPHGQAAVGRHRRSF